MGGLAAAAEHRVPVKKEKKEKNSAVKLKANVGLPKKPLHVMK